MNVTPRIPLTELEQEIKILLKRISEDTERVNAIRKTIDAAKGLSIGWNDRIIRALTYMREPLTTSEILTTAFLTNPEYLSNAKLRRVYVQQLSFALNRLCTVKHEIFGLKINGVKGKVYCLKAWQDTDGDLRPEYRSIVDLKIEKLMRNAKNSSARRFFEAL